MNTAPYLVAHITDLHIKAGGKLSYRLVDTAGALHRCIDTLLAAPQQPDAVIVTGDLVDFGADSEYQFLRQILQRLPMPVRLLPGNHDSRSALRRVFADHDYLFATGSGEDPVHYCIDAGAALVAFDCTVPGQPGGRVDPAALPWLEAALSADPARPTLLLLHHPPFFTGIGHMDEQGLATPTRSKPSCATRKWNACCAAICIGTSRAASAARSRSPRPGRRTGGAGPGPAGALALSHGAAGLPAALVASGARAGDACGSDRGLWGSASVL